MQWDIYPDEEGRAPIAPQGWNHVRLVVAGGKMLVYDDREAEPSLVVPKLQGFTTVGGIAFKGPALDANPILHAGTPSALPDMHQAPADPATVTAWLAAAPTAADHPALAADIPTAETWHAIAAEPSGLVNLSRAFGVGQAPSVSVGWLKTFVTAMAPARRTIRSSACRRTAAKPISIGSPVSGSSSRWPSSTPVGDGARGRRRAVPPPHPGAAAAR